MLAIHISIAAAILLFLISFVVGIISDSITLLLDASAGLVIILVAILMKKIIKYLLIFKDQRIITAIWILKWLEQNMVSPRYKWM